jgi:diaminohydroxyphosphoribosylaminopyrimidine deaminase/5-amino-6-(5-phosphoribosylamino)uracil reductase
MSDHEFMARALRLARRGLYTTTPNPRVGCVIVNDNQVVGEGWHERAGESHAEVTALSQAGDLARGATLYVTLEPCSHFGRTPPCADAILKSGIRAVVCAMIDPNPEVSGKGLAALREKGIEVRVGVLEREARELNIGFVNRFTRGRPWIRVKIASGLDGKTALENGESQWITTMASRRDVHRWRAQSCAVLTGVGTVSADNPGLDVRHVETERQPKIFIVDSHLRIPRESRLLSNSNVTLVTAKGENEDRVLGRGFSSSVLNLPGPDGKVDLVTLASQLAFMGVNEVLVEAGINLQTALMQSGLVDEIIIYYAPKFLGDKGRGMFDFSGLVAMDNVKHYRLVDIKQFGNDFRVRLRS